MLERDDDSKKSHPGLERRVNICELVAGQDGARVAIVNDTNETADVCSTPIGDNLPHR
jgi:hypothetical protein